MQKLSKPDEYACLLCNTQIPERYGICGKCEHSWRDASERERVLAYLDRLKDQERQEIKRRWLREQRARQQAKKEQRKQVDE